jgi:hypothetical protein
MKGPLEGKDNCSSIQKAEPVAMTIEDFGAKRIPNLLAANYRKSALKWLGRLEGQGRSVPSSYMPEFERGTQGSADAGTSLRKVRRLFWNDPAFWGDFIRESGIADCAKTLLEKPALIFHAAFLKPRVVGSAVGFHQDQGLWPRPFPGAISIWIALDEANEQNGCLLGVPGSQKHGLLPHVRSADHSWHPVVPLQELNLEAPRAISMSAGDGVAWHRYFVHGSGPNRSEQDRRGVVMVFAPLNETAFLAADVHQL